MFGLNLRCCIFRAVPVILWNSDNPVSIKQERLKRLVLLVKTKSILL